MDAAIAAGRAESTRKTYASAWRRFERWCADRAVAALPATPAAVCAYLVDFAQQGVVSGTIEGACAAIADAHQSAGHLDPVADETVRQVRRGIRRMLGTAPRRQAYPLTPDDVRKMVGHIDRNTVKGARDAALILLGFASALRRSELAALTMADLERKPAGLLIHVRRSKGDPEARGQLVGIASGRHPGTDPLAALDAWLALRGTGPGPLFTNAHHGRVGTRTITGSGLTNVLKDRAAAAGIPSDRITGHSLRAGHATTAAMGGVGRPDRRPDPAPPDLHTGRALHPAAGGAAGDLEREPRPVSGLLHHHEDWGMPGSSPRWALVGRLMRERPTLLTNPRRQPTSWPGLRTRSGLALRGSRARARTATCGLPGVAAVGIALSTVWRSAYWATTWLRCWWRHRHLLR